MNAVESCASSPGGRRPPHPRPRGRRRDRRPTGFARRSSPSSARRPTGARVLDPLRRGRRPGARGALARGRPGCSSIGARTRSAASRRTPAGWASRRSARVVRADRCQALARLPATASIRLEFRRSALRLRRGRAHAHGPRGDRRPAPRPRGRRHRRARAAPSACRSAPGRSRAPTSGCTATLSCRSTVGRSRRSRRPSVTVASASPSIPAPSIRSRMATSTSCDAAWRSSIASWSPSPPTSARSRSSRSTSASPSSATRSARASSSASSSTPSRACSSTTARRAARGSVTSATRRL